MKSLLGGDIRTEKWAKTARKIFTGYSDTLSQSIGSGQIRREKALVVRESRDWSDQIFVPPQNAILA